MYVETTSTPFELINIKGNVRKCSGCSTASKMGPDPLLYSKLDENWCIRHKEHDSYYSNDKNEWMKTFSNKHYHIFNSCISERNPTFDVRTVNITSPLDQDLQDFITHRFS